MSIDERNWDLAAAEYVLGVGSDEDRKVYNRLYEVDEDWQHRVHRWQSRLNPLHESTPSVKPPERVLSALMARVEREVVSESSAVAPVAHGVDGQSSGATEDAPVERVDHVQVIPQKPDAVPVSGRVNRQAAQQVDTAPMATLELWRERARYWQLATVMAVASLVGVVVLGPDYLARQYGQPDIGQTVAVLQGDEQQPLWAVTYAQGSARAPSEGADSQATGIVSITVVGEPILAAEQSHQLWMVLPEGGGVRSVGLVPSVSGQTATFELPLSLDEAAEFAVSLEPLGGVPGPEHGPVVTRAFIVRAQQDEA